MRTLRLSLIGTVILVVLGPVPTMAQEVSGEDESAEAPGPVTWVTGSARCPGIDLGESSVDDDGVRHFRGGEFTCDMQMSDPRVSGTHTSTTWNADVWGESPMDSDLVQWATVRLENEGGAWEGWLSGVASLPDPGDIIAIWYEGTGDYAGLSYFEQWTDQDPWTVQGLIFPGDPPVYPAPVDTRSE